MVLFGSVVYNRRTFRFLVAEELSGYYSPIFLFFLFPALKGGKKLGVDFFNFLITLVILFKGCRI